MWSLLMHPRRSVWFMYFSEGLECDSFFLSRVESVLGVFLVRRAHRVFVPKTARRSDHVDAAYFAVMHLPLPFEHGRAVAACDVRASARLTLLRLYADDVHYRPCRVTRQEFRVLHVDLCVRVTVIAGASSRGGIALNRDSDRERSRSLRFVIPPAQHGAWWTRTARTFPAPHMPQSRRHRSLRSMPSRSSRRGPSQPYAPSPCRRSTWEAAASCLRRSSLHRA